jgi:flagellar motor switch protein FliM
MRSPLRPQSRRITHPSVVPDTQLYDFRQAAQLSPDQVRMLTHQAASLAAVVSRTLQAYLDADVSFDLKSLETVGYEQYVGAA